MSPRLRVFFLFALVIGSATAHDGAGLCGGGASVRPVVRRDDRQILVSTEHGEISSASVSDGAGARYHLHFITMKPNALFIPSVLHADMVLYVRSGIGRLSWVDGNEMRRITLEKGDVYRMPPGTVFFIESNNVSDSQHLRIYSIFTTSVEDLREPSAGAYSTIRDLFLGFDKKVLMATFKVAEEVVEEMTSQEQFPVIVEAPPRRYTSLWEQQMQFVKGLWRVQGYSMFDPHNKKHKSKTFNVFRETPDVQTCNGWALTATRKQLPSLQNTNIGVFMVNLTKGSMMAPHWNQMGSEVSVVVKGQGIVRVVCSSVAKGFPGCTDRRWRVEEGDVFVVPNFRAVSQMSFNNDTFVFMGFTIVTKKTHPQFLGAEDSVLQVMDKLVLAASFNVSNATIDQLLANPAPKGESVISECTSCAEEEEMVMEEEIERDPKRREEEEARRRQEMQEMQKEEDRRKQERAEREEEEAMRQEREREEEERRGGGGGGEEEAKRGERKQQGEGKEEEEERGGGKGGEEGEVTVLKKIGKI